MSKKIIAGNWKMNLDYKNSLILAEKISKILAFKKSRNEIIIFPDFSSLLSISQIVKKSQINIGAQDVAAFPLGAYTGEISTETLKQINCKYILIGHSERRQYFGDNNFVADKLENVIKNSKITPILCIGESLVERKKGETFKVLSKQLSDAFSKIKLENIVNRKIIIAYEPVWAIGTGLVAEVNDIILAHREIKKCFSKMFKGDKVREVQVLYGGSVNVNNFLDLENLKEVDGLLIGGASLKAGDFLDIAFNF
ncbi:triose-phosphate isomerase [Candidatus Falkowbacteria bacterium HGW-Falkowbacteria-1]|jgi:triosephosphate isomerase|uniref:Triosephosphate isomerase n=1 Tax=Candidatus Falkowbacteria bacterium HGW-Falkowbacteria-1 TaxID=2013768 RepID=A0A2N2EAG5_9BACT|nr:MAG: triose-phosphate isomerase [Candidatus Falkowbacteria bacterium HGW-Falkowbacteria-1]